MSGCWLELGARTDLWAKLRGLLPERAKQLGRGLTPRLNKSAGVRDGVSSRPSTWPGSGWSSGNRLDEISLRSVDRPVYATVALTSARELNNSSIVGAKTLENMALIENVVLYLRLYLC